MSKANGYENAILLLYFNAVGIANIADNAASAPATALTISLHTADPGESGTMTTSECTYTGYTRVTVPRTSGGWTVTGNSVSPAANITFPVATAGTETATHWGIGSGVANNLAYSGTLSPTLPIGPGSQPLVTTSSTITED